MRQGQSAAIAPLLLSAFLLLCVGWYLLTRRHERAVAFFRGLRGVRSAATLPQSRE